MTPTFTRGPGESVGVSCWRPRWTSLPTPRGRPGRPAAARPAATDPRGNPWSSDGSRSACGSAPSVRLGGPRPGAALPPGRRLADRHRDGGGGVSGRVLHARPQRARARIYADGGAVVQTATQEFGTGVLTVDDAGRGRRPGRADGGVRCEAGDTDLPNTTAAVGSSGAAMVSSAVHAAAMRVARPARRAGRRRRGVTAARRRASDR